MSELGSEPTDDALATYVKARLEQIAPSYAEPEMVAETLAMNRDIWLMLYKIDRAYDPTFDIANPS